MNEEQLIKGCIRRDRIAQKYFYDTFSPKMYPLCCRYVKDPDDAEDTEDFDDSKGTDIEDTAETGDPRWDVLKDINFDENYN